jgi:hypothetical protein
MPTRPEDQPWYARWREALDRVIAAQMARERRGDVLDFVGGVGHAMTLFSSR